MKKVTIDLTKSFEEMVAKLRSIPPTDQLAGTEENGEFELSSEVQEVLRRIYEAARGRQVATRIGLIGIAPPVAAFLAETPFPVATQADFLLQALARLYRGSSSKAGTSSREIGGEIRNPRAISPAHGFSDRHQKRLSHAIR